MITPAGFDTYCKSCFTKNGRGFKRIPLLHKQERAGIACIRRHSRISVCNAVGQYTCIKIQSKLGLVNKNYTSISHSLHTQLRLCQLDIL